MGCRRTKVVDLRRIGRGQVRVALRENVTLAALDKLLHCIGARGLEQPQARFGVTYVGGDQRFRDQLHHVIDDVPKLLGLEQVAYLTNSSMMAIHFVPRHLIIVGGSYVGLEFAQMYRRFGSEVTVVETVPRLVHREDPDVSAAISEIIEAEGIHLRTNAECVRVAKSGDDVLVGVDCTEGPPEIRGSHLLLAVGKASQYR